MSSSRRALILGVACACILGTAVAASAASDSETLIINATVAARAKLVLAPTTIDFPDADPDVVNPIPAIQNSVNVLAKVRTSAAGAVTLTCLANGDLVSGSDNIGIDNVTWTASGSGYTAGTMDKTTAQAVGSWTGSGVRTGSLDFFLANDWAYAIGSYTQTVDYTLSAP